MKRYDGLYFIFTILTTPHKQSTSSLQILLVLQHWCAILLFRVPIPITNG